MSAQFNNAEDKEYAGTLINIMIKNRMEDSNGPFQCSECQSEILRIDDLINHLATTCANFSCFCEMCRRSFPRKSYEFHVQLHHLENISQKLIRLNPLSSIDAELLSNMKTLNPLLSTLYNNSRSSQTENNNNNNNNDPSFDFSEEAFQVKQKEEDEARKLRMANSRQNLLKRKPKDSQEIVCTGSNMVNQNKSPAKTPLINPDKSVKRKKYISCYQEDDNNAGVAIRPISDEEFDLIPLGQQH